LTSFNELMASSHAWLVRSISSRESMPRSASQRLRGLCPFLLLVGLLLTSCTSTERSPTVGPVTTSPTPQTSTGPVTITWTYWGDPWEIDINQKLVKVFEADHPEIKVETLHTSWSEYFQKADQWLAGETTPDVMFFDFVPVYASKGLLENLSPYIARDSFDIGDFYSGLLQYHTYGGQLYGLPRDNDTKVIFFNKALFDEAGLPYPSSNWTWNDLRNDALKLTKRSGNDTAQYGFAYEPGEWWRLWAWQNGGEVYDNDFAPTRTLLEGPRSVEAIQWLADLTNVDKVTPPYDVQKTSLGIGELFSQGKLAMAFGNHALVPAFASIPGLKWDIVGLPRQQSQLNVAGGSGYVIPARSKNKEAAWTFLKWLESPKGQAIFAETGVIVPARRSVGHADIFLKAEPIVNASAFLEETELGRPNPMYPGVQEVSALFDEALVPVWRGEASAKQAISGLVPIVDDTLQRLRRSP